MRERLCWLFQFRTKTAAVIAAKVVADALSKDAIKFKVLSGIFDSINHSPNDR